MHMTVSGGGGASKLGGAAESVRHCHRNVLYEGHSELQSLQRGHLRTHAVFVHFHQCHPGCPCGPGGAAVGPHVRPDRGGRPGCHQPGASAHRPPAASAAKRHGAAASGLRHAPRAHHHVSRDRQQRPGRPAGPDAAVTSTLAAHSRSRDEKGASQELVLFACCQIDSLCPESLFVS